MRPITLAAALLLITASATANQQSALDKPNVVLIMTDDAGYADTGSYGAPDIRTPHIDSLARDGVRLTDFYANGMSCTPTRAGLIAGRYQQRYGIEFGPSEGAQFIGAEPDLWKTTRLSNNGYITDLITQVHRVHREECDTAVLHRRRLQRATQPGSATRSPGISWPVELAEGVPLQRAVVRLEAGCPASFVSPDGLLLTNHRCVPTCPADNSTADRDLVANGDIAVRREDQGSKSHREP